MEICHHVGFNDVNGAKLWDLVKELDLENAGVILKITPVGKSNVVAFDIAESNPKWKALSPFLKGALDIQYTIFSREEILSAKWLRLIPGYQTGYPQPESTWVTNPHNYSYKCPECGVFIQNAPFHIKKEPSLKYHQFISLFWSYDLFSSLNVISILNETGLSGFETWDVLLRKNREPSEKLKQIVVRDQLEAGLERRNHLASKRCSVCKTVKYASHMRGIMLINQAAFINRNADIYQTSEWFGWGHSAYREFIISNRFAQLIIEKGWKGIQLKVVDVT